MLYRGMPLLEARWILRSQTCAVCGGRFQSDEDYLRAVAIPYISHYLKLQKFTYRHGECGSVAAPSQHKSIG